MCSGIANHNLPKLLCGLGWRCKMAVGVGNDLPGVCPYGAVLRSEGSWISLASWQFFGGICMSLILGISVALLGGGRACQPACYNMGMVYTAAPCAQQVFATPVALAGCTPIEVASPVANRTTETEKADPVSQLKVEATDPALAAADRPETLSQELGLGTTAKPVSSTTTDGPGNYGGALGFLGGLNSSLGGTSGGFGFGNGQGAPGRGSGGGSGTGGGNGSGDGGGSVNVDNNTPDNQGVVVNVNTTIANLNNNSQSQIQSQYQTQNQNQNQNQNMNGGHDHNNCCGGGGEQVPLPATVWMGLFGTGAVVFARRRLA